jgi:hypothetical protein
MNLADRVAQVTVGIEYRLGQIGDVVRCLARRAGDRCRALACQQSRLALVRVLAVAVAAIGVQIVRAWSAEPWRLPPVDRAFDGQAQFVDVAGAFAVPGRFHPVLNVSLYSKFLEKSTHKLTFARHTSWGCLVQWV